MAIRYHPHALERMKERGAAEGEVETTVKQGEQFPTKFNRTGFRRNFSFNNMWRGKYYENKQLEVYAVSEGDDWLVISLITRYF
jgi:hypothetical protein